MNPSDIKEMLANAQNMRADVESKLDSTIVEASSGGGLVTARMNGRKQLLHLTIEPTAMGAKDSPDDLEMLQDLIVAAVNAAGAKADASLKQHISGMMGGMNIPGLM